MSQYLLSVESVGQLCNLSRGVLQSLGSTPLL